MKRVTILVIAVVVAFATMAQNLIINEGQKFNFKKEFNSKAIDTLAAPVFYTSNPCADTLIYYAIDSGYLTGNGSVSGFPLAECSQAFDLTGSAQVTGAIALMMPISGTSGTITAKVYSVEANMKPGNQLAQSNNFSMAAMTPNQINTVPFSFTTPVNVSGNFAVSVVYPTTQGDSVVVFSTMVGCVDPAKDGYAYVKIGMVNQWMQYKQILSQNSYPSIDLFIFAIVNTTSSGVQDNKVAMEASVYPNPAKDNVVIASLNKMNRIHLINSLGQTITSEEVNSLYHFVDVSNLPEGVYFAKIETVEGTIIKKFVVSR